MWVLLLHIHNSIENKKTLNIHQSYNDKIISDSEKVDIEHSDEQCTAEINTILRYDSESESKSLHATSQSVSTQDTAPSNDNADL